MNRLCMGHLFLFNLNQCWVLPHTKMTIPQTELTLAGNRRKKKKKKNRVSIEQAPHSFQSHNVYINEDVGFTIRTVSSFLFNLIYSIRLRIYYFNFFARAYSLFVVVIVGISRNNKRNKQSFLLRDFVCILLFRDINSFFLFSLCFFFTFIYIFFFLGKCVVVFRGERRVCVC